MKFISVLLFLVFAQFSPSFASVIKTTIIDGQQYSCRPSSIEPPCRLKADADLMVELKFASNDAMGCLSLVPKDKSKVKECFLQKRIKEYAKSLDYQMINSACWETFVSICAANYDCAAGKCGYLAEFLNNINDAGLNHYFNESDGLTLCRSLVIQ